MTLTLPAYYLSQLFTLCGHFELRVKLSPAFAPTPETCTGRCTLCTYSTADCHLLSVHNLTYTEMLYLYNLAHNTRLRTAFREALAGCGEAGLEVLEAINYTPKPFSEN